MRHTLALLAAVALTSGFSATASADPALDTAGKCRDNGKFVAAKLCATSPAKSGKCRDITTKKFAKCSATNTEAVPSVNK
ncbi:MAG: hypothetical protein ABI645_00075 [Pseudomonadota bacterium]